MDNIRAFLARTSGSMAEPEFFKALANYLGEALGVDHVRIDSLEGKDRRIHNLAIWPERQSGDSFSYTLKDESCGDMIGKAIWCIPSGAQNFFPKSQILQALKADGFAGRTLFSHAGKAIGLISLITNSPIPDQLSIETTLNLAGIRAEAELERLLAEHSLWEREEYQRAIFDCSPLPMYTMDTEGRVISCNAAAERTFGWPCQR